MSAKQFAIIGMGRFGRSLALKLSALGHDVLAVDKSEDQIEFVASDVTHAVIADATDEHDVASLGLGNFDAVVVTIGSDIRSSVMAVMLAQDAGAKLIVAKATDEMHSKILNKIGANRIVMPEKDMGERLALRLVSTNVMDFMELSNEYTFSELLLPAKWQGKSLRDLDLRARYGANVVAVRSRDKLDISPRADLPLQEGDKLIMIAPRGVVEKLDNMLG